MLVDGIFSGSQWCKSGGVDWCWTLDMSFALATTLLISLITYIIYRRIHPRLLRTKNLWDDTLLQSLFAPIQLLIWLTGLSIAIDFAALTFNNSLLQNALDVVRSIVVLFAVTWFLWRYIGLLETRLIKTPGKNKARDTTMVYAVGKLVRIVVLLFIAIALMQVFGVKTSAILTLVGGSTVAIGFGAKDLLANFFGSLMIYMDRPFKVGDWIRSPDKTIDGIVEYIGWRSTTIRTLDKRQLHVPNMIFLSISIENASRMTHRRINELMGLRYNDVSVLPKITEEIEAMLHKHPDLDGTQTTYARLVDFAESSLNIQIYAFTKTTDSVTFQKVQQDVFLKIITIVHQNKADIAFPTTTIDAPTPIQFNLNKLKRES